MKHKLLYLCPFQRPLLDRLAFCYPACVPSYWRLQQRRGALCWVQYLGRGKLFHKGNKYTENI